MDRAEVSEALEEIALLLQLKGENPFKARAYQSAARTILGLAEDLDALVASGRLASLKGIGEAISEKVATLVATGSLPYLEELRAEVPRGLLDLLRVPGLGPKRARAVYDELGVDSLAALESACMENRLASLPGFGARTQEKILSGIEFLRRNLGRFLLSEASTWGGALLGFLKDHPGVARASLAGSLRRRREVIGDVDLVAAAADPRRVIADFTAHRDVEAVLGAGETKASVRLKNGIQVDLRVVDEAAFPFALHYFTGSKAHNIAIRRRAESARFRLKLNEYGLFRGEGDGAERIPCEDEEVLYAALDLPFIPPELREDAGEIEAAERRALPRLVERRDLRGTFHVHTTWSDGRAGLEAMVRAAAELGFEYVGISDHSRTAGYARGLKVDDVARQREEIEALRGRFPSIRILHGTESDILHDGSLDYPEEVLDRFDFVVGSIHSQFGMPEPEMTRRVVRALENPHLTILGHPTGRLLLDREGFRIDLDAVLAAAARAGAAVEINANPHRLDLDASWCRRARDAGVLLSIDPDAHDVEGLADVGYGVDTARRGWLEPEHVLNTRSWEEIAARIARKRSAA
jgi:DNA polymerase (family 10)